MRNILSMKITAAAFVAALALAACSSDDYTLPSGNGGMVLRASVAGQESATRATMEGTGDVTSSTADGAKWTFGFEDGDKVSATNNTMAGSYYTFTRTSNEFTSAEAKATSEPTTWYAYFPSAEVSLANQDGAFAKVANYYAMAGTTDQDATGEKGLDITLKPQVAVLRVVKVEKAKDGMGNANVCDVNVRTADGHYVAGMKAKKSSEAGFNVTYSSNKVTMLSQQEPGVYYIAVPAGIKLSIYNGSNLRGTTKDAGFEAGKYYTVLTDSITGTAEATIDNERKIIHWVQMYPGGEKIATENVDHKLTWEQAAKKGDDYVWGKNWRTPTDEEIAVATTNKMSLSYTFEKAVPAFTFTGNTLGYTKNKLLLHANVDTSNAEFGEASYWSATESDANNAHCLQMMGNLKGAVSGVGSVPKIAENGAVNHYYVRPIINDEVWKAVPKAK